jgi:hypothetical protein
MAVAKYCVWQVPLTPDAQPKCVEREKAVPKRVEPMQVEMAAGRGAGGGASSSDKIRPIYALSLELVRADLLTAMPAEGDTSVSDLINALATHGLSLVSVSGEYIKKGSAPYHLLQAATLANSTQKKWLAHAAAYLADHHAGHWHDQLSSRTAPPTPAPLPSRTGQLRARAPGAHAPALAARSLAPTDFFGEPVSRSSGDDLLKATSYGPGLRQSVGHQVLRR